MKTFYSLKNPKPNAEEFIDILLGKSKSTRVPLVEYIVDDVVMHPIVSEILNRKWADYGTDRDSQKAYLDNFIEFWYRMGYDFVRFEKDLGFPENQSHSLDISSNKTRYWPDEHSGTITNWSDFEKYPWPKVEEMDFFPFDYINNHLPEGMGFISCHGGGVFEHLSWIMSYEGLSISLYDNPELVQAVSDKIGDLLLKFYYHLLDYDNIIAVFQGDDMGFRTGTMISPDDLRTYCLPWHQKFADLTHSKNKPYLLHSCGKILNIMHDLVSIIKIDGKHSFEDAIISAEDFQQQFGNKIAVLGGIDINILAAGTPDDVRKRTRELIENCGYMGRFAVGSGNSIPSYIPVENYLTMIDEALR